jgi:hypothetical protein
MTTLRSYLLGFAGTKWKRCNVKALVDKDADEIYAGTTYPESWCVVLAYTDIDEAKAVVVQAIQNAAADLDPGALKTLMESLSVGSTEGELDTIMTDSEAGRRGATFPLLYSALHAAAKFLKIEKPELIRTPIVRLVRYEQEKSGVTKAQAVTTFYAFLHGEVDATTWKGGYT